MVFTYSYTDVITNVTDIITKFTNIITNVTDIIILPRKLLSLDWMTWSTSTVQCTNQR